MFFSLFSPSDITISPDNAAFGANSGGEIYVSKGGTGEGAIYFNGAPAMQANNLGTIIAFEGVSGYVQTSTVVRIGNGNKNLGFYNVTSGVAQQAQTVDFKDVFVNLNLISSTGGATPLNLDGGTLTSPITQGNTIASGTLTLSSTSNATKGKILFGTSVYDEVNNRLGVGTIVPEELLHVAGGHILIDNTRSLKFKDSAGSIHKALSVDSTDDLTLGSSSFDDVIIKSGAGEVIRIKDVTGNVGFNTTSFGTNAAKVLGIAN